MTRLLRFIVLLAIAAGTCLPAAALDLQRRRMLTAAEHVPWRAVGRVNIEVRSSARGMCTGTLIAEDLVLTAAHCVVSDLTGLAQPPGNVHFVAGWRLGMAVAHSKAARIAVHPRYDGARGGVEASIPFDLALIRLETPIPRGKAPFFAIAPAPAADSGLTLVSYRRDREHALTRQDGCAIARIEGAVLTLGCEVTFGASGSPLFQEVGGETRVVAVLSAMSQQGGRTVASAVLVEATIAEVLAVLD
jgi:protease YdgD